MNVFSIGFLLSLGHLKSIIVRVGKCPHFPPHFPRLLVPPVVILSLAFRKAAQMCCSISKVQIEPQTPFTLPKVLAAFALVVRAKLERQGPVLSNLSFSVTPTASS